MVRTIPWRRPPTEWWNRWWCPVRRQQSPCCSCHLPPLSTRGLSSAWRKVRITCDPSETRHHGSPSWPAVRWRWRGWLTCLKANGWGAPCQYVITTLPYPLYPLGGNRRGRKDKTPEPWSRGLCANCRVLKVGWCDCLPLGSDLSRLVHSRTVNPPMGPLSLCGVVRLEKVTSGE